MPELPEVETVCKGLEKKITGQEITKIDILFPTLRYQIPPQIKSQITNSKIIKITRRARYILIEFANEQILLIHLGMSGSLNFCTKLQIKKHDHVIFYFSQNNFLIYNDPRRFGVIDLVSKAQINNHKMIKNLGPEPLSNDFNPQYLSKILKNKRLNIKTTMMDNKIVVGVGNIYINEALFLSKISPILPACELTNKQVENLVSAIKEKLTQAIKLGGSTLQDYVDIDGNLGYFQNNFQIYGRANQSCFICNSDIVKIKQNGRSSFYCKKCQ